MRKVLANIGALAVFLPLVVIARPVLYVSVGVFLPILPVDFAQDLDDLVQIASLLLPGLASFAIYKMIIQNGGPTAQI